MSNLMEEGQNMAEEEAEKERRLQALEKKVESLQERVEAVQKEMQTLQETVASKEDIEAIMSAVEEKFQTLREDWLKETSTAEEMLSRILERLNEGVPLKGADQIKRLRRKIGRYLSVVDKTELQENRLNREMENLSRESKRLTKKMKEHEKVMRSGARATERSEWALKNLLWIALGSAATGGATVVLMLMGLTWIGIPAIPQEMRMTEGEIQRVRQERYQAQLEQQMTETEWNQYRNLLKKVEDRRQKQDQD